MAGGQVNIGIGFSVDKSGLSQMQSLFQQIANSAKEPGNQLNTGLQQAAATANKLDAILEKTFNTNLGTLNVTKFNQELSKSGMTLKSVQADLSKAGNQGATAYNRLSQAILGTNLQLKQSNKLLDSMATTMANTVKWGITSSIFNTITNSIQKAYTYSKQLNTSLNDIRIVTDKSADSMERFAEQANEAAKGMGASTLDYTNAALIYYQQGLTDSEVQARAETTIKAANVTGQTGEEVSEQLTAVWNGYKVTAEETEAYVDKLAAVAATTAADLEELSVGMSKVAAAANSMGVDFDDLNAQIATIVSVTRQAPESVGTALKTIYARLGDLKVDGVDEFGVKLGEVSAQMQTMGVQILDQNGDLRDMSSVIAEVAQKWTGWTEAQRQAAAVAMAGKRQYNNLIALFDNWDMYTDALNTSVEAVGTLQHQQDIYMESTVAKLKTLKATWQDLYDGIIDDDELNTGIEGLTNLVQVFDNFIDSFGGGIKSIGAFGAIVANIFNKQIVEAINSANQRQAIFKQNLELVQANYNTISAGVGQLDGNATPQQMAVQEGQKIQLEYAKQIYNARLGLNQEQANTLIGYQKELGSLQEELVYIQEYNKESAKKYLNEEQYNQILNEGEEAVFRIQEQYEQYINNTNVLKNNIKEIVLEEFNIGAAKAKIVSISKSLNEEDREELLNLIAQYKTTKDLINGEEEILRLLDKQIAKYKTSQKVANEINNSRARTVDLEGSIQNTRQEADALLTLGNNAVTVAQRVTMITSALGTMAMAWSSVHSLMQTLNNDSISVGDKLVQSFMTIGMSLPMVISSFNKLNEVFPITLAATIAQTEAEKAAATQHVLTGKALEAKQAREAADAAWKEYNANASMSRILVEELEEKAIEKTAIANKLEEEAEIENQAAKEMSILTSKGHIVAKIREVFAIKAHKTALDEDTQAAVLNKAALLGTIAVIGALIAVIALVVKAIDNWHENQKKLAEETLKEAKAAEEQAKANKELIKTFNNLYKEYNDLKSNQEDVTNISEQLRETTLELAEAYNIAGASLLTLSGNYDILNKKIKEARDKELKEIIKTAGEGAEAAAIEIGHNMTEGSGYIYGGNKYTNQVQSYDYYSNQRLLEATRAVGAGENLTEMVAEGQESTYAYNINFNIHNAEEAEKELSKINNLLEYYESRYTKVELDNDAVYKNFQKEKELFIEQFGDLTSQLSEKYSAEIELAFNKIDFSNLSVEEVYQKIEEVKKSLSDKDIPTDKIDEFVKHGISEIDDLQDHIVKIDLAERIQKKTGQDIDEILSIIKDFNQSDLALLNLHLETALLSGDLEEWVKENSPILMQAQLASTNESIKNALNNYDEKKGFDEETLNSVFNKSNAEEAIGMTTKDFNSLDYGDQLQTLTEAWMKNTKTIIENREEVKKQIEDNIKDINEEIKIIQKEAESHELSLHNMIQNNDRLKDKEDELKQALQDLAENGYDKLKPAQQALIDNFEELDDVTRTDSENYGAVFNQINNLNDQYDGYISQLKQVISVTEDHIEAARLLQQVENAHSAILDDIQSAYQSLTSIVDDYNETGEWTIDNVQKLIAMDDAYVATLQFENGQLSINEQSFQAMTLAKLDDLEQTVLLKMQEDLLAIAQQHAADTASANAAQQQFQAAMVRDGIEAAREGAAAWRDFAAAQAEAAGVSDAIYQDKVKEITDATYNRLQAIQDARKNVKKGGSSFKRTMGAGKSSKGGGGGKERQEKELKNLNDEFDRYWEIKKAIDAVDLAIKRLAKDQKNLYGTQLIDSLKIQNDLLEQQKAHYDALWEAQEQEAAELRAQLGTMGLVFDASGAITNYAAATTQALADYNAAIQQYNAGLIDDTALQVYEKSYENFKKLLERYDTLYYKEIQDTIDKIDDLRREQLANNLKAWEVKIELKLNLKELKRGWIDFIKEINEDFQKVYKDLRVEVQRLKDDAKTYIGDDGSVATTINAIHDVTAEIDKMQAGGTSIMFESISQAQEKLKELNDTLQDNAKGLHDLWKAAWDNYLDGIDEVSDRFEDLMDQFERMDDELEFQGQLIELLYGEKAYEMMDKLYKGQERSLGNQVQSVKTQMDMWERLWRESGATMENQSSWTEDQKKYYDEWTSAQSKLNDLVIDYIKLLKDDYLNTIEKILTELERGLTGSSLANMKTEWERITEYSDKYLDDVEQAYEAQKLANKIDEEIAKTNDVKKQQKLQAFRDKEIKYLREKEHLTQYDLDAAEARYQIALKEMALEDARNNKTSMKLVRNEQGNWSYQYLADEEETASKQQELLDAYNDLYQLASDAYEANLEALQTLQEKYLESAKEIYEDETLSEEEKEQKLLELRQWYFQQYALLAEENTLYRNDLATSAAALLLEIYNEDEEAYQAMTDAERQLVDDLVSANIDDYMDLENKIKDNYKNIGDASKVLMSDTRKDWNSSAQQIADNWINSSNNVRSEVLSAHAQIQQATDDYQAKVAWVAAAVERDFGLDGITGAIWEASYATDDLKDTTIDLVNESIPYLESLKQAVDEIEAAWNSVKDAIEAAIAELERYISLEAHYAQQQAENRAKEAVAQAAEAAKSSSGSGSGSGFGGGSSFSRSDFIIAGNKNGQDIGNITGRTFASYEDALKYLNSGRVQSTNYNNLSYSIRRADRSAFATGGYTGSWNGGDTDGRLAVLHQKELVLNKEDTSNFLSGIQMLRDMTSTNGSISNAIMQAVANMASSLGNIRANRLNGTTMVNETTENNGNIFNIQAEFPNANDANEIRQALLSLPNLASQYIARNGR